MKIAKLLLMLTVVLMLVLAGCTAAPPSTGAAGAQTGDAEAPAGAPVQDAGRNTTLIVQLDGGRLVNPEMFNPFIPGARRDQGLHNAMWEPLFILNYQSGEIEPWLGESFTPNETQDVWTLTLQEGAYWSDGEPVTSDDVIFTINMLIENAPTLTDSGAMQQWVQELNRVDDRTVEFVLTAPNPRFQLSYFSVKIYTGLSIVPEHIWSGQDPTTFTNYDPEQGWPVFSGQFKLENVNENEAVYVRDDNWWGAATGFQPLPAIEKLLFVVTGTEEQASGMMAQHNLDYVNIMQLGAYKALAERDPNIKSWAEPPLYTWVDPCTIELVINHTVEPWNDKDMRWVLNYALNRQTVIDIGYEGAGMLTRLAVPKYPKMVEFEQMLEDAGLFEQYPMGTWDAARAEEILTEKGYTMGSDGYWQRDGAPLSINLPMPDVGELPRVTRVVIELLQQFGIDATGTVVSNDVWWANLAMGQYDAQLGIQGCGSINEPYSHMAKYVGDMDIPIGERGNPVRWTGPAADAFAEIVGEMAALSPDDPRMGELWVEGMALWLEEAVAVPLVQNTGRLFVWDETYWTNWPSEDNPYIHGTLWWATDHAIWPQLQPVNP